MGYECFEVREDGAVAHVVMTRGEQLNTMTPAFWRELPEIVDGLSDEGRVRAIVLSSTGRHFTAGMDLSVFGEMGAAQDAEPGRRHAQTMLIASKLQHALSSLERARMPVLAAVQGGCVGGGVDLVCAADMRYATEDAFFVIQEINIGMTADVGTLQRLPKLVPDGVVRELAYTGRRMPARRAAEVGLVNEVFADHDALVEGVLDVAREIASKSPLAIWGTKRAVTYARDHSVDDALEQIATWQSGMFQPADMMEAFAAKQEGREAEFPGLLPAPEGL